VERHFLFHFGRLVHWTAAAFPSPQISLTMTDYYSSPPPSTFRRSFGSPFDVNNSSLNGKRRRNYEEGEIPYPAPSPPSSFSSLSITEDYSENAYPQPADKRARSKTFLPTPTFQNDERIQELERALQKYEEEIHYLKFVFSPLPSLSLTFLCLTNLSVGKIWSGKMSNSRRSRMRITNSIINANHSPKIHQNCLKRIESSRKRWGFKSLVFAIFNIKLSTCKTS
jgi:hypothetical protein